MLLGPTVNITLETGTCTLVWSDDYTTKSVVCSSPSVSYVKVNLLTGLQAGAIRGAEGVRGTTHISDTSHIATQFVQTPTTYVHKHFKPAEFSTGACILKKEITQGSEKVLYR